MDLIFGYAIAFSLVGIVQSTIASIVALSFLGVTVMGGAAPILIITAFAAFLGTALGLLVSAFARSEFQAVQLVMPILMPQVLLCGLFVARENMADWLYQISNFLPLTYTVDAMRQVAGHAHWTDTLTVDLFVIFVFGVFALILGSVTIRRQN
jgi:ABC-2 type transport system permease protein